MTNERRSNRRVPVEMWVEESRGRETYYQRSGNLSEGGIYLEGTIPHAKGTIVQLKFTLPGEEAPIAIRGEIVGDPQGERLGMNVKFLDDDLRGPVLAKLRAFVDRSGPLSIA